jgi:hypothetical protein
MHQSIVSKGEILPDQRTQLPFLWPREDLALSTGTIDFLTSANSRNRGKNALQMAFAW